MLEFVGDSDHTLPPDRVVDVRHEVNAVFADAVGPKNLQWAVGLKAYLTLKAPRWTVGLKEGYRAVYDWTRVPDSVSITYVRFQRCAG